MTDEKGSCANRKCVCGGKVFDRIGRTSHDSATDSWIAAPRILLTNELVSCRACGLVYVE